MLGCNAPSPRPQFSGSPYSTNRCPRKAIDNVLGIGGVISLYGHTEGRLGPGALEMASPLVQAFGHITEGQDWDREQKAKK